MTALPANIRLEEGDCLDVMARLAAEGVTVDAVVTDPPYHLTSTVKRFGRPGSAPARRGRGAKATGAYARTSAGFMGKQWDGVESPKITAALGHWLAGFADGEGCFTVRRSGKGFTCEFVIHLRGDDANILHEIKDATGVGDVSPIRERKDDGAPMVKWVVRRQKDCARLVQIFEAFPLRAKKARDFDIWASAVREWIDHAPGESWEDLASHAEMLSAVKLYGSAFNPSQFFHYRWARLAFQLLKPGGYLLAFGGTRTYHRLASGLEDAGFEVRDMVSWLYGSGFPKSKDQVKAIDRHLGQEGETVPNGAPVRRLRPGADQHRDGSWEKLEGRTYQPGEYVPATPEAMAWRGWGTALKPACEPIVLARKPLSEGSVAANVLRHGTGALNVDGCRVEAPDGVPRLVSRGEPSANVYADGKNGSNRTGEIDTETGRWPANVAHDGSEDVLACFPDAPGQQRVVDPGFAPKTGTAVFGDYGPRPLHEPRADSGSAARFFYTAKADAEDRWGSRHPTVKPVALIRWLMRLVTPPGGLVLDPFAGSGTAGVAALAEGFGAVMIERDAEYLADIRERLAHYAGAGRHSLAARNRKRETDPADLPLFGGEV